MCQRLRFFVYFVALFGACWYWLRPYGICKEKRFCVCFKEGLGCRSWAIGVEGIEHRSHVAERQISGTWVDCVQICSDWKTKTLSVHFPWAAWSAKPPRSNQRPNAVVLRSILIWNSSSPRTLNTSRCWSVYGKKLGLSGYIPYITGCKPLKCQPQ